MTKAINGRNNKAQKDFDINNGLARCFDPMPAKVEYPPLFPIGFHPMTLAALEQKCVVEFPLSKTRAAIMDGLKQIVYKLENSEIAGELWIDGSFVTEKIDPEDADIVLFVDGNVYDTSPQNRRDIIDQFDSAAVKSSHHCDSYVSREYPIGHPLHDESIWDRAYWHRQWGFSRNDDYKGIVTFQVRPLSEIAAAGDPYAQLVIAARRYFN